MRQTHVIVIVLVIVAAITSLLLYVNSNVAVAQSELSKEQLDAIIFGNGTIPPPSPPTTANEEESFNQNAVYEDMLWHYKLSYPSNLTKYQLGTTITGHGSITDVGFGLSDKTQAFFTVATARQVGNFMLKDHVTEEIGLLSRLVGYKQFESSPTTIGGNPAHKIVYTVSSVKNGVEIGQVKAMEIVTIHDLVPFFIEYATLANANDYEKYLPIAQKMIDSFQFND